MAATPAYEYPQPSRASPLQESQTGGSLPTKPQQRPSLSHSSHQNLHAATVVPAMRDGILSSSAVPLQEGGEEQLVSQSLLTAVALS